MPPPQSTLQMKLNKGQMAARTGILRAVYQAAETNRKGCSILLEGAAGTGKTAVIGEVLSDYVATTPQATNPNFDLWGRQLPGKLCVAAMSHKAKGELLNSLAKQGITNHPVLTVDQLLKARPVTDPVTREKRTQRQQIPLEPKYELIIIDEVSMMSQQYFDWLMEWKHDWQTIVFIGDQAQLPPVQDGKLASVFKDCGLTFKLDEVVRHEGVILDVCKRVRSYGKGYPSFKPAKDDEGEVAVFDSEEEFLECLYAEAEKDHGVKVLCHTNANVQRINKVIHERRNPGCEFPFVRDEHVMAARAIEDIETGNPLVPSSMDMQVVDCVNAKLNLGMDAAEHLIGMDEVRNLLGSDGGEDIYRCHKVQVYYFGGDRLVDFYIGDYHRGEKKRFDATQVFLKGYADDRTRGRSVTRALNRYILWRERHFAAVHLSTAMTIHKSQGSSFTNVWVYPDIPKRNSTNSNKLAYVACSRARRRLNLCNR